MECDDIKVQARFRIGPPGRQTAVAQAFASMESKEGRAVSLRASLSFRTTFPSCSSRPLPPGWVFAWFGECGNVPPLRGYSHPLRRRLSILPPVYTSEGAGFHLA